MKIKQFPILVLCLMFYKFSDTPFKNTNLKTEWNYVEIRTPKIDSDLLENVSNFKTTKDIMSGMAFYDLRF